MFVKEGRQWFIKQYSKYWMHTDEEVLVLCAETGNKEKVIIHGLDHNGYLKVKGKADGHVFSVQDNGNSFDLLQGLIHPKL